MDVDTFRALLSSSGQRLLSEAETAYVEGQDPLSAGTRLRRAHPPALVAAAMTQVELRHRARTKFGSDADRMYFTVDGLQQATHGVVAAHRAARAAHADGVSSVLDLGCGLGSDLAAFARAGLDVTGVERDPVTVAVAEANLATLGLPGTVRVGDAVASPVGDADLVFVDPARRSAAGRVFRPEDYSPPWDFVSTVLQQRAVVKVAPGIDHRVIPDGVEAEWVSLDRGLKEAALWSGLPSAYSRAATLLSTDGDVDTLTDSDPACADVGDIGDFVYEPDDAVTRAHLVTRLAAAVQGRRIDPHIALVTGDQPRTTPYARCFEVVEVLPYREKQLRSALRARNVGTLTIKPRGVDVVPERLRTRLALRGSEEATIIVTRTTQGSVSLLVRPVPDST